MRKMGKPALTVSRESRREGPAPPRKKSAPARPSSRRRLLDANAAPPADPEPQRASGSPSVSAPCSWELGRSCPLTRELHRRQRLIQRQKSFLKEQAHTLRAHLHAVMGYAGLVLRKSGDCLPKQQAENLNKLLAGAEALKNAINRLEEFPY